MPLQSLASHVLVTTAEQLPSYMTHRPKPLLHLHVLNAVGPEVVQAVQSAFVHTFSVTAGAADTVAATASTKRELRSIV